MFMLAARLSARPKRSIEHRNRPERRGKLETVFSWNDAHGNLSCVIFRATEARGRVVEVTGPCVLIYGLPLSYIVRTSSAVMARERMANSSRAAASWRLVSPRQLASSAVPICSAGGVNDAPRPTCAATARLHYRARARSS